MKNNCGVKKRFFDVILVALCSFVGVGFITGAEIWFYFARFGVNMIWGIIVFGVLIYKLTIFAFSGSGEESYKTTKLKNKVLFVSEILVASAMISGLFETARTLFDKCWFLVFVVAISLLILLFFSEKKSFIIYNYFVSFFIIFVIVNLFFFNNDNDFKFITFNNLNSGLKSSVLSCLFSMIYVFMNVSEIRPILERNSKNFNLKTKRLIALFLSILLIFLIFLFSFALFQNGWTVNFQMPFLMIFKRGGGVIKFVFLVGVLMTMISTAQGCLIGAKDKLNYLKNDNNFASIIVILSSLIFGQIPFWFFIKIIYPILAVLNFNLFVSQIISSKKLKTCKKVSRV